MFTLIDTTKSKQNFSLENILMMPNMIRVSNRKPMNMTVSMGDLLWPNALLDVSRWDT